MNRRSAMIISGMLVAALMGGMVGATSVHAGSTAAGKPAPVVVQYQQAPQAAPSGGEYGDS